MLIPGNIEIIYIGFNKKPLNPLSGPVRKKLLQDLQTALNQPAIEAIILLGSGNINFSAGADISEFQKTPGDDEEDYPTLIDVVNAISFSSKPIIAGIRGVCLGGGMELALAADYRIGEPGCKMGLPEVKIGLIPGAHGTQRLPRLVSPEIALKLITTGKIISCNEALQYKILDTVSNKDKGSMNDTLEQTCIHYATWALTLTSISKAKKLHERQPPSTLVQMCDAFQKKIPPKQMGTESVYGAIAAIRASASTSSYEEGCVVEAEIFWDLLLNSTQGRGFRHVFFTERAAQKRALPPPIIPIAGDASMVGSMNKIKVISEPGKSTVGVIGAGTMGTGIALSFLLSRTFYQRVILVDTNAKGLKRASAFISKTLGKRGKKSAFSRLQTTTSIQDLKTCNLIIEAVFENLKIKQNIFDQLQHIVEDQNAILASNTSTLSIDAITDKVKDSKRRALCAGMHFFSPAHIMRLVEIVQASHSAAYTLGALRHVTKTIGKVGVVVGNCDGFVGNRMLAPYAAESAFVVQDIGTGEGVSMVDDALGRKNRAGKGFGMALGPFEMGDLAGNDIGYLIRKEKGLTTDPDTGKPGPARSKGMRYTELADDLVSKLGRNGQKTLKGWYDYKPNPPKMPKAVPSPEVSKFISSYTGKVVPTPIPAEEIIRRCLFPLVNEAFKILEEGFASDPGDVDVIYIYGYGWPAWRGGPMYWADNEIGLPNLLKCLETYYAKYPGSIYFKPSALLQQCVKMDIGVQEYYRKMNKRSGMSKL